MAAAEIDHTTPKHYYDFVFTFKNHVVGFYSKQKERLAYCVDKVYELLKPILGFFVCLFAIVRGFFLGIKHGGESLFAFVHYVIYFEYKQSSLSLLSRCKELSIQVKARGFQILWVPVKKRLVRLKKKARKKILDVRIYLHGFRELCRRLFLLASDYTPGGQWTVILILCISTVFIGVEIFRYSKYVFQFFEVFYSTMMFLLTPVIWTLHDVWAVVAVVLEVMLSLLRNICGLISLFAQGALNFISRVVTAFASVIWRSLVWIFEMRCVQFVWLAVLKLSFKAMEVFVFRVLPFLMDVFGRLITLATIASTYFYDYFVVIAYTDQEKNDDFFSSTQVCTTVFIIICLLVAYLLRKRFPSNLCSEIEEAGSPLGVKTGKIGATWKRQKSGTQDDDVHFQISSTAHICMGFLRGECKKGRRCENHHCPWPYHWQYRVPVQGWKSFSLEDSDKIELLYCNPANEIAKTSDIDPDLSAMTRRSHVKFDTPIRLDFQQNRMEVKFYRPEIRRLSTESYVKCTTDDLATRWTWYQLSDKGGWTEYGDEEESIPKQTNIELCFSRRESAYKYKRHNSEYRIYFFMTPMYERNMNPREYKRRFVRRRPVYRSLVDT